MQTFGMQTFEMRAFEMQSHRRRRCPLTSRRYPQWLNLRHPRDAFYRGRARRVDDVVSRHLR